MPELRKDFVLEPKAFGKVRSGEFNHPLRISILQGNLLTQRVDAIINPANESLRGGGGLDGMIHAAAEVKGKDLLDVECAALGDCPTGEARITRGYNLPAKHIIHAVGPIYPDEPSDKWSKWYKEYQSAGDVRKAEIEKEYKKECERAKELLLKVHKSILQVARENQLESISIPAISTGVFRYPTEEAAQVAKQALFEDLRDNGEGTLKEINFVLWETEKYNLYEKAFSE